MPKVSSERERFSHRLQQALRNAQYVSDSPTTLAREFNLRFDGAPITVHAARKWLIGESIPTQDKMRTLADWLMVPIEWLRFGEDSRHARLPEASSKLKGHDMKLLSDLQLLDDHHRQIAREFVRYLLQVSRQRRNSSIRVAK